MKKIIALLCSLLTSSVYSMDIFYQSRNMPADCEFVYQVQSEIKISLEHLLPENTSWRLVYQLKNALSKKDQYEKPVSFNFDDLNGSARLAWGFESMSTANAFLFREMRFQLVNISTNKVAGTWFVSFGREFGELCYRDSAQTPFIVRSLLAL